LWRDKTIQRARVRNVETAERDSVLAIDGIGVAADARVMILDLAERASVRPRRPRPSGDAGAVEQPDDEPGDD
jgi:hypothetical protein